jgi:peptide/nickel transport system substrate-binding protein
VKPIRIACVLALSMAPTACGGDDDAGGGTTEPAVVETLDVAPGSTVPDATIASAGSGEISGGSGATVAPPDAKRDAVLRMAPTSLTQDLNPYLEPSQTARSFNMMLHERLMMLDHTGTEVLPGIAESWEFSDDGLQLTLHLRDDATFTDGSPVRAEAVKFSLEQAKTVEGSVLAGRLAALDVVEVVDPLTVVLQLSSPTTVILYQLASTAGAVLNPAVVNASTDWTLGPPIGAGSGGYVVESFVPGESLVLERVERPFWDPAANQVKRWEFQAIAEPATAVAGLLSGEFDLAQLVNAQVEPTQQQIDGADGYQLVVAGHRISKLFMMNTNKPHLADARVRQAIAYGVDWETIAANVLGNGAQWLDFQYFTEDEPGYLPEGSGYGHDPAKAAELLAEAGVSDLTITVGVPTARDQSAAEVVKAQLEPLGITLELVQYTNSELLPALRDGLIDATLSSTASETPVALLMQNYFVNPNRGELAGADIPELQAMLADVTNATASPDAIEEASRAVHRFALDKMWMIQISGEPLIYVAKDSIVGLEGMEMGAMGPYPLRYVYTTG